MRRLRGRNFGQRPPRQTGVMLDGAAIDHIKLLADPCNGKLVFPAYESPGGGALIRFRRLLNVGTLAGETTGVFSWTPGHNEYFMQGLANNATGFIPNKQTAIGPLSHTPTGQNSAPSFRCVAACLRLITNASESNRSGIVFAGVTDSNMVAYAPSATVTTEQVANGLPVSTRAPSKHVDVLWTPMTADMNFWADNTGTGQGLGEEARTALTCAFWGAPPASGYTVELTGVYEVNMTVFSGAVAVRSPPPSMSSWNQVLSGFTKFINNSPILIDGVRRAVDYVATAGKSYVGAAAGRAAMSLLTL